MSGVSLKIEAFLPSTEENGVTTAIRFLPRQPMQAFLSFLSLFIFSLLPLQAGVYGDLEFGDDRATVTRKLQQSKLVKQTVETTHLARTGLNGVFACTHQLAGLDYALYFDWDDNGQLCEITLRSDKIELKQYSSTLVKAWTEAAKLFSQVYGKPVQNGDFPKQADTAKHGILMSHIWHRNNDQSILMGPGIKDKQCFLAIRFLNQRIEPVIIPAPQTKTDNPPSSGQPTGR